MFKEDPDNIHDTWLIDKEEESASENTQPPDIDWVPVCGYNKEFYEPLLENTLGGSDAPVIMVIYGLFCVQFVTCTRVHPKLVYIFLRKLILL